MNFMSILNYPETEIAKLVNRSVSIVRQHLENIEIAKYRAKKHAEVQEPLKIPEVEQAISSAITEVLDTSILASEFDRAQVLKERIGNFTVWNYNGRTAAQAKGTPDPIFLTKDSILHMKALRRGRNGKRKLGEYLLELPEAQREVVSDFIETLIDEDLGMFPMLRASTRVGDAGEIDSDEYEAGRFGGE